MSEFIDVEKAKAAFAELCNYLNEDEWKYSKDDEKMTVKLGAKGDDLEMEFDVTVDKERMLVVLISRMPFGIPEDKRVDMAVATSVVNNMLVDGSFDFNIKTGNLLFRLTNSIIDSTFSKEYYKYMILCSCKTIDEFNDKFLMIAKNVMSVDDFIASINK